MLYLKLLPLEILVTHKTSCKAGAKWQLPKVHDHPLLEGQQTQLKSSIGNPEPF